jgi:hypothetical protein
VPADVVLKALSLPHLSLVLRAAGDVKRYDANDDDNYTQVSKFWHQVRAPPKGAFAVNSAALVVVLTPNCHAAVSNSRRLFLLGGDMSL